jgi:hypothetical protein
MGSTARRRRAAVLWAVALAAGAALWAPGLAGASGAPTGMATPSTGLRDGQIVTVSGAGFDPGSQVGMVECLTGATDTSRCDLLGLHFATTDGAGSFSSPFVVNRVINVGGALTDCATADACVLGLAEAGGPPASVAIPLSFLDVPIVPPAVTVTPSAGLLDRQIVDVGGTEFNPGATVALLECPADSTAISDCDFSTGLFVVADGSGAIATPYTVSRVITVAGASVDCAAPPACVLGVGNVDDFEQRSVVALSFQGSPIPVPPPVSTPPPPVSPSPPSAGLPGPTLAMTGLSPWPLLRFGGALVLAGALAMLVVPRPSSARRARPAVRGGRSGVGPSASGSVELPRGPGGPVGHDREP